MSDPASTARTARESLARGLSALQSDPNIPPQLLDLAAPIAQSMGALHQIERSNGAQLLPHANIALENVRHALASLQAAPPNHPAVGAAMEAVASSLGLVHALSRLANPNAAQPQAAPVAAPAPGAFNAPTHQNAAAPQQPFGQGAPRPTPAAMPAAQPYQPQPYAQPMAATVAAPMAPQQMPPQQMAPQHMAPQHMPPQQMAPQHMAPQQMPPQQMPPQQMAPQQMAPQHAQPMQQPAGGFARDPFAAGAPPPGAGGAGDKLVVSADLGAQSPTNFYKGLSGNDIVDHGGLFVSTYMIPKIGTPIRLKVSLPGGYEFEADAVVRWARDVRDASSDAPPGFGAQFTSIAAEHRQLIYRYVRNREPLFHDDL